MEEAFEKEPRTLACRLTQEEFNDRATKLANTEQDLASLNADKSIAMESYKRRMGTLEQKRTELAETVRAKTEMRDVPCTWHADWIGNSMILRRDDTGEAIDARTITAAERQQRFELTDDGHQLPSQRTDDDQAQQ